MKIKELKGCLKFNKSHYTFNILSYLVQIKNINFEKRLDLDKFIIHGVINGFHVTRKKVGKVGEKSE